MNRTLLELFKTLKGDLEMIRVTELCRVIEDFDAQE